MAPNPKRIKLDDTELDSKVATTESDNNSEKVEEKSPEKPVPLRRRSLRSFKPPTWENKMSEQIKVLKTEMNIIKTARDSFAHFGLSFDEEFKDKLAQLNSKRYQKIKVKSENDEEKFVKPSPVCEKDESCAMLVIVEKKSFECDECKKVFARKFDLKRHKRIHNKNQHEEFCKPNPSAAIFEEPAAFDCDEMIHSGEKPIQCGYCSRQFIQRSDKKGHEQFCKANPNIATTEERAEFECNQFATKTQLKQHQMIHAGAKGFECSFCGQSFMSSYNKNRHEKTSKCNPNAATWEERAKFECEHCKKRFIAKQSLKKHQLQCTTAHQVEQEAISQ